MRNGSALHAKKMMLSWISFLVSAWYIVRKFRASNDRVHLQLMSEPRARTKISCFGQFLTPICSYLAQFCSDYLRIDESSGRIREQLAIEAELQKYFFLGGFSKWALFYFKRLYLAQILSKQPEFLGRKTHTRSNKYHRAENNYMFTLIVQLCRDRLSVS